MCPCVYRGSREFDPGLVQNRAKKIGVVRVRWIDHKCKVNCDEFDREESYLRAKRSWYASCYASRSFFGVTEIIRGSISMRRGFHPKPHRRPQAKEHSTGHQPLTLIPVTPIRQLVYRPFLSVRQLVYWTLCTQHLLRRYPSSENQPELYLRLRRR